MTFRSRSLRRLALCSLALSGVALAGTAQARPERLRWTHLRPSEVQRFDARVSALDGSNEQIVSLGVPTRDGDGVYETTVEVGDGDVQIALRAAGPGGVLSAWSATRVRLAPTSSTGGSTGGSGGGSTGGGSGGGSTGGGTGSGGDGSIPVGAGTPITPTPGASQRFDFSASPVGNAVAGWLDTRANYSLASDDNLFGVTELGTNRVLYTSSIQNDIHSHAMGANNVWSSFEVRGRMAFDHDGAAIGITTYSGYDAQDTYYRLGRAPGGEFVLSGRHALSCGTPGTGVTPVPGDWYRFELHVQDLGASNQIVAKIWRQDQPEGEPAEAQISCTDSSAQRPRDGRIGVWSGGSGRKYWDDLEIIESQGGGTGTAPAPPVLLRILPVE